MVADDGTVMLSHDRFDIGSTDLSTQEAAALSLMTNGLRNAEIAVALNMTVRSFYNVRARLFKRLGARTQEHAAAIAFRTGLLEVDRSEGAKICCGGAVRER